MEKVRRFLVVLIIFSNVSYAGQLWLKRKIESKCIQTQSSECYRRGESGQWVIHHNYIHQLRGRNYAYHTPFAYKVRTEAIWLEIEKITSDKLISKLIFEKNDFPMDENWDVIWKKRHVFELRQPFVHQGKIEDRLYRMTFEVVD